MLTQMRYRSYGPRAAFWGAVLAFGCAVAPAAEAAAARERLKMDAGWRFAFGHPFDAAKDFKHATSYFSFFAKAGFGDGPAARNFDDRPWRMIDLPHDWAVELPFDERAGYSHGYKALGRNFPETSVGWYRRSFRIPESDLGRRISVEFDGVHRNATVFINGFYLGEEHNGTVGFRYDLTDYLEYGGVNVIAVRVDAMMEEGWYYEGAGIYRHVWLTKTGPLHVAPHGVSVSAEPADGSASIRIGTSVVNESRAAGTFTVEWSISDGGGRVAASGSSGPEVLGPGAAGDFPETIRLADPELWSPRSPALYTLTTTIRSGGTVADRVVTAFGIRSCRFEADSGFFLNGERLPLRGVNLHQDHAGVGTAVPDGLTEFRLKKLKEIGCNAVRSSHNPPSPELLDACDRLGLLVIDENRLMGVSPEHLDLLKRLVLRDRNHPSVLVWSIGNEEWAIENNETGARLAATMQDFVRHLDPTRRVTYAASGWGKGISDVIDVMGFNYIFNGDIDSQHRRRPGQPSIGTEETTSRGTRGVYGDDPARAWMQQTDRKPGGRSLEEGFRFYAERPFLSGLFYWTGFDHRGEPNPYGWPQVASQCGIFDLCGFPKDMAWYLKAAWTGPAMVHIFPHWNWAGREGHPVSVWAYSNCDAVELFLDGRSLGRRNMPEHGHQEWTVPYRPGVLSAKGFRNGKAAAETAVETTGPAFAVRLSADKPALKADGEDVIAVTVRVEDASRRTVPTAGHEILFRLEGPGRVIGVGNGDPASHEPDRFIETVSQAVITGLRAGFTDPADVPSLTGPGFDDAAWPFAIDSQGNYAVRAGDTTRVMVLRGELLLPDLPPGAEVTLYPKSLGEIQSVFVNGRRVAEAVRRDDPVVPVRLDPALLRTGRNVYAVAGKPLAPRYLYDNLNTDPGVVRVSIPPSRWRRNVFNGLAQVIIQSTGDPGRVRLFAESTGLKTAVWTVQSETAPVPPSVPVL
ncbi:MAG: beta-galactosidase GalA [bacterium]|nr:beta-galactosidase GalA [bacterium]